MTQTNPQGDQLISKFETSENSSAVGLVILSHGEEEISKLEMSKMNSVGGPELDVVVDGNQDLKISQTNKCIPKTPVELAHFLGFDPKIHGEIDALTEVKNIYTSEYLNEFTVRKIAEIKAMDSFVEKSFVLALLKGAINYIESNKSKKEFNENPMEVVDLIKNKPSECKYSNQLQEFKDHIKDTLFTRDDISKFFSNDKTKKIANNIYLYITKNKIVDIPIPGKPGKGNKSKFKFK
jgi:hypothetical protein